MVTLDAVKSFLLEKFWRPIANESVFYNPFNTAVYSALFALAAAYIGYPLIKKLRLSFDRDFFMGIAPFIFLGGAVRSLKDIDAVNTVLLETPFIYVLMFGFTLVALIVSIKLEEYTETAYHRILASIGLLALIVILPFYSLNNIQGFAEIILLAFAWILPGYLLLKSLKPKFLSYSYSLPIAAHYLDATVTSVALIYPGTAEKHVLGRFFIDIMGPAGMFVMKTLIIVPAVYYINENVEGEEKRYYLFLIALLGFAIATRNFLSFVTLS